MAKFRCFSCIYYYYIGIPILAAQTSWRKRKGEEKIRGGNDRWSFLKPLAWQVEGYKNLCQGLWAFCCRAWKREERWLKWNGKCGVITPMSKRGGERDFFSPLAMTRIPLWPGAEYSLFFLPTAPIFCRPLHLPTKGLVEDSRIENAARHPSLSLERLLECPPPSLVTRGKN